MGDRKPKFDVSILGETEVRWDAVMIFFMAVCINQFLFTCKVFFVSAQTFMFLRLSTFLMM